MIDLQEGDRFWIPKDAPTKDQKVDEWKLIRWLGMKGTYLRFSEGVHDADWDSTPPSGSSTWTANSWIGRCLQLLFECVCGECGKEHSDKDDYLCEDCRKLVAP